MGWARIDDDFPNHPKVWRAGLDGVCLFVEGLCHAAKFLTDGKLKRDDVERMRLVRRPLEVANKLVSLGLWERQGDGFQIHDYLHYNPAAENVRMKREATRTRMRSARSQSVRAHNNDTCARDSLGDGMGTGKGSLNGEELEKPHYGAAIMAGQSAHRAHAACFRVCVPAFIHEEFLRKLPEEQEVANRKLRAWYLDVDEQWQGKAIGDRPEKFWRARFEEWQGTTQKATHRGPSDTWVPKEMREAKS